METILYLSVTGSKIKATNSIDILSNSENWYKCSFSFDSTWDGLSKTVVFSNDKKSGTGQTLESDNTCYIPACVLQQAGYLFIGVVHSDILPDKSMETLPTQWIFVTIREGVDTGTAISPPDQNVYKTILGNTTQALAYAADVENRANAGDFTATVTLGTVTTGASGSDAVITNSGSQQEAVFNFTLPRGIQGDQGIQGETGAQGPKGDTGDTGPQGPQGATGEQGIQGETGTTGPQGIQGATGPQGPAGLNWLGAYSAATAYAVDDAVSYNGSSYICVLASTGNLPTNTTYWELIAVKGDQGETGETGEQGIQGETGATGPQGIQGETGSQGPAGLNWLGVYSAATAYVVDDAVSYNGSSYICVLASTGNLPTNTTYWQLLAQKGTDGAGAGDMLASVYDPTSKNADAFNVDNHVSGTTNKVYTATEQSKLSGIEAGAEVNVNADWNAASGDAQILNKPSTFTPAAHTHGNLTNDGKIGETALLPIFTGTDGVLTTKSISAATYILDAVVRTGDQSIGGIKEFTSFPLTPVATPTSGYQVANKKYVDDSIPTVPDELADLADDSTHRLVTDTEKSTWNAKQDALSKATGAEADTGTDDAKFLTAKAVKDSHNIPSVAPGNAGNVMRSNGTDWVSASADGLIDIISDTTPQLGGELDCNAHTIGCAEYDNGNSGTSKAIDWRLGNHQKVMMTGNCTFTFTAPTKPCMLSLRIIQDATGSRTITMPTMKLVGGTGITWSTTANAIDILSIYYDGTNYYGQASIGWA